MVSRRAVEFGSWLVTVWYLATDLFTDLAVAKAELDHAQSKVNEAMVALENAQSEGTASEVNAATCRCSAAESERVRCTQRYEQAVLEQEAAALIPSLQLVEIPRDGDCLFSSVAAMLGFEHAGADLTRAAAVNWVKDNPSELMEELCKPRSISDYASYMASRGVYGDEVMIHALAEKYAVGITVLSSKPDCQPTKTFNETASKSPWLWR